MSDKDRGCALGELLPAYHDGELSPEEKGAVRQHLHSCRRCQERLNSYRQLRRAVRQFASAEEERYGSYSWWPRVRTCLLEPATPLPKEKRFWKMGIWPRPVWIALAVSAAVAMVLSWPRNKILSNYCQINSISSPEYQLFIYREKSDGSTVIWLLQ